MFRVHMFLQEEDWKAFELIFKTIQRCYMQKLPRSLISQKDLSKDLQCEVSGINEQAHKVFEALK